MLFSRLKRNETAQPIAEKGNFVKRRAAFANSRPMPFTIRELTDGWRSHALTAVALGLFLTFLGPFGTQIALSPGPRMIFWVALVGTGYLLALAASRLIGGRPRQTAIRALVVAALSALPQTFIVGWALVQIRPGRVIAIGDLPMLFLAAGSIQLIIALVQLWTASGSNNRALPLAPGEEAGRQAHGRITPSLRGDLVALEAEDHYVRVHHGSGSTLILHRFGDAIAEVEPTNGVQVHRGWWVARDAVAGTFVRDGKRWLIMNNGLQIPVSRTHLRRVIEQAWPRVADPR